MTLKLVLLIITLQAFANCENVRLLKARETTVDLQAIGGKSTETIALKDSLTNAIAEEAKQIEEENENEEEKSSNKSEQPK